MGVFAFTSIIFASDTFITLIKQISMYGIPFNVALLMIILNLPAVIVMTIPMGVLLSTVMTLNKLSLDSEITVLRACGIGLNRIAKPIFIECGSAFNEAQKVSEEIKKLSEQGIKYNDIAVLARTNAQLQLFESKLASNNIQYNVFNDTTFIERPEIKLALMYIRLAHDTNDDEAFSYIYNKPLRWLDKKFLAETTEQALRTHKSLYESMFKISRRDWKFKGGIDEISKIVTTIRKGKYKTIGEELQALREIVEIDKFVSRGKISEEGDAVEQIENLNTFGEICNQFTDFDEFNKYIVNIK